jgi:NAD(P)H-nitrite reductase large subunit
MQAGYKGTGMNNHVVIIGASVSGHNIALRLRERSTDSNITLISEEDCPPYDHLKLPDLVSGVIGEKDIFLCDGEYYAKQNINFIINKKAGSLNIDKQLIYFKDKGSINYDILVIASGRSPVLPEIPGAKKEGVCRIYTLEDVREFMKRYIAQPVCIVGSSILAMRMAEAVALKYGVEVKLLSRIAFDPADMPQNIEIIHDSVAQIIGEGETQAVKLKSGKALGVCAVLFMDDYRSNIDFLKGTDIAVKDDFIQVDGWMRTCRENIFACGSVVRKDSVVISMMLVDHIIERIKEANVSDNSTVRQ